MKIEIIAPSACVDAEKIHQAQHALNDYDIQISLAPALFAQHRYLAGSAKQRVLDLEQAMQNDQLNAIWCGRGGTGAAQLLPYLGQWMLNTPLIGYSDSTVLLNYIAMQGGKALHAPVFQEIASKNLSEFAPISSDGQEVLALLSSSLQNQVTNYPIFATQLQAQQQITYEGRILGGNLATLCSLQGTPWALQLNTPSILLLEDVGEPYYRIERLFVQLLQSVDCRQIQAIVLGDFYNCPQKNVPHSLIEIIEEHLNPLNIPLYQADWFGHGEKNRPFWLGAHGKIHQNILSIT